MRVGKTEKEWLQSWRAGLSSRRAYVASSQRYGLCDSSPFRCSQKQLASAWLRMLRVQPKGFGRGSAYAIRDAEDNECQIANALSECIGDYSTVGIGLAEKPTLMNRS